MPEQFLPAVEFQALPLEAIVSSPLVAAVKAQYVAANTTVNYVKSLMNGGGDKPFEPMTASFKLNASDDAGGRHEIQLDAPLLSMVPVPHFRIDSLTTHFKYEISQVTLSKSESAKAGEVNAGVKYLPFLDASLKGSVSSRSADESTTNRSGVLEITVHASEAPIPEGLARLLSLLAKVAEPRVRPVDGQVRPLQ